MTPREELDHEPIESDPTGMRALLSSLPDPGPIPEGLEAQILARLAELRAGGAVPGLPDPPAREHDADIVPLAAYGRDRSDRHRWFAAVAGIAAAAVVGIVVTDGLQGDGWISSVIGRGSSDSSAAGGGVAASEDDKGTTTYGEGGTAARVSGSGTDYRAASLRAQAADLLDPPRLAARGRGPRRQRRPMPRRPGPDPGRRAGPRLRDLRGECRLRRRLDPRRPLLGRRHRAVLRRRRDAHPRRAHRPRLTAFEPGSGRRRCAARVGNRLPLGSVARSVPLHLAVDRPTDHKRCLPVTEPSTDVRNVVIIGSGPAGYTAAVYAARANLEPVLIEGAVTAGGALMNTTEVENFPGFEQGIMGPDLMLAMRAQAERFGTTIVTDDVTEVDLAGDVKTVTDGSGNSYRARSVILAMGSAYRELGLPDEKRLSGHGVSWCATCDGFFFRDQDIAVVGGGDSAVEEATFLTKFARSVTIVHRRDALRASKIMADRAHANEKIKFAWNSEVSAIHGEDRLTGVTLRDTVTGEESELPVTGLFVAIGHDPRNELIKGLVDLDAEGYVLVEGRSTRTNLDGVFACGDLVDHTYRQAITAAGSGCAAALDAERWLADQDH